MSRVYDEEDGGDDEDIEETSGQEVEVTTSEGKTNKQLYDHLNSLYILE